MRCAYQLLGSCAVGVNGDYAFDSSFGAAWEQRWNAQDKKGITFATLVEFSVLYKGDNRRIDGTIIIVLAHTIASDTAYLNLGAASENGLDSQWSTNAVLGWKHPSKSGKSAIVADAVFAPNGGRRLELSWQSSMGSSPWTVGPGVGFDVGDGPSDWNAGVVFQYTFDTKEN